MGQPDQEDGLLPGRQGGRPQQTWRDQERWKRHGNNSGCCQGWPGGLRHSYNGLEANAKVLGNNLKQNSVKVVQHKYGNQAGDEFGKACTAAGNAAMTYMNIQSLGAKGLVKKTAKNTGKNIAKNIVGMEVTQAEVKQRKSSK